MWTKQSLRRQILVGYFILVGVIAAVGVWAIYNVLQLNKVLVDITKENYISVIAAENMIGALERQDSGQLFLLIGEDRRGREISEAGQRDFVYWLDREANNITLPGEDELVRQVEEAYGRYRQLYAIMQSQTAAGKTDDARRLYLNEIQPTFGAIRENLQVILKINDEEFMAGNARSGDTARQAAVSVAVASASAVIFGVLFAVALSKAVVKPTVRLTDTIRRIREGNLTETVETSSQDEMGTLAREFNSMLQRLRDYESVLYGRLAVEQQKALAIVRSMKDGVLLLDNNRRIVMLNPAAASILGAVAEAAIGQPFSGWAARSIIGKRIEKAIESDGETVKGAVAVKRAEGDYYYEIQVVPFAFAQEGGLAVILKDVTYFKVLEQKKASFLAGVAHELRTPLTSISMGVGMLGESGSLKAKADKELLAIIQEETDRLRGLVDDLLELARLDSDRRQLKLSPVNVAALFERVAAPFRLRAEAAGVTFITDAAGKLLPALWDADKIQSVLGNLIENALRYTGAGGTITFRVAFCDPNILFSVDDTGSGIPAELQERIFESFYQVEGKAAGRAGLGLAICQAIVKRHGGEIWVESQEGHGAQFFVALPPKTKTS